MHDEFSIDELPLGSGTLGLCPLPGRNGDPTDDLARLVAFRPALVVSLALAEEMAEHGVADLPDRLAEAGIRWRHFPIADFGAPAPENEPVWRAVAAEVRGALDTGRRVVVHCKAGRGRTGTVALRLMIEAGEDPSEALIKLRAARPGTVETPAQQRWAMAGAFAPPGPAEAP